MQRLLKQCALGFVGVLAACAGMVALGQPAHAETTGEFSLQVSPSPFVSTLKPGERTTLELKIRNTGIKTENLRIAPRTFTFDDKTQQLQIDDTKRPEVADWVTFSAPTFTIRTGETFTQRITIAPPKDAGFSYSFALVISRTATQEQSSGTTLKGSVAVFSLFNVDRPGAKRQLEIANFSTKQPVYEYLPARLDVSLRNTGNTIVQPAGNVFIQRGSDDKTPLDTLPVNKNSGYILPGSTRTLEVQWENGFQVEKTVTNVDGSTKNELTWNWSNLSNLRFGKYTAKLVAIYNDGQRDIPIMGEVSFWVIPWKMLLIVLVVILLLGFGIWSFVSKIVRLGKRIRR
jgi:hypothetical protein